MPQTERADVVAVASRMGFPFQDGNGGKWAENHDGVWMRRFTKDRRRAGPGILLCFVAASGTWLIEFENGVDEKARTRCLQVAG